jgi:hypothetical protein
MANEASEYFRDAPPSPLASVPADRHERWELIREMIRQWFPADLSRLKLPSGMGPITKLPTACPAVQEWYKIVSEATGIWCRQDHLFAADGDWRRGNYLMIAIENQACAYWGIPLDELERDDPPVFVDRGDGWMQENPTVSEFAITWLAYSIKWSEHNRRWANSGTDNSALRLVIDNLPRLKLTDWHWPTWPTRFFGSWDLIVEANGEGEDIWIWVSARTDEAFDRFCDLLKPAHIRWEASSDD